MTEVIRTDGLTKRFGDFTAVDDVSFTVASGEIFGFLGPNGAGKTTTIKMLCGLLHPTAGSATVAGYDVVAAPDAIKQRIGYMSQLFSLYADLTVQENIALFGGLYGVTGSVWEERRRWILEMSGLERHQDQLTGSLPLGWKQRLALGCAMLHEPPVLFLDEPTSGVDPIARRQFWDLIDTIAARGTAVLVSTHYMEEAEYCHRLALMNRARVIALSTPHELRDRMIEPLVRLDTDDPPRTVEALRHLPGVVEASMYGRTVRVVLDPDAPAPDLAGALETHGIGCESIASVPPSLEDVFVSLVRAQGGAVVG